MGREESVDLIVQVPSHADDLFGALSDPTIYEHLDEAPPKTAADLGARINHLQRGHSEDGNDRWLNWTVFLDSRVVGYTQATIYPDNSASIACVLSPSVWGRGVGHRACQKMIEALTKDHHVSRICADTERDNRRSQGLLTRLGFRETNRLGNDVFFELWPDQID